MKRTTFVAILVVLIFLTTVASIESWYLTAHEMMDGRGMGQMMGAMSQVSLVWLVIVGCIIGIVGLLAYYVTFPEIKSSPDQAKASGSYDVVLRFLKEDEKKVVEFLRNSGNESLQKDIVKDTGFSKIRTHRILARLAERGLITAQRQGKTNRVRLLIQ